MVAGGEAAQHSGKREKDDGAQFTFSILSQLQAPVRAAVTPTCSVDVPMRLTQSGNSLTDMHMGSFPR